jgi:FMN phosphatase YigB (HAD superfamily)
MKRCPLPDLHDRRFDAIAAAVRLPLTRVLSVDCFDTLLMRRVPKPADVHLLVGTRLEEAGVLHRHITPQGFAKLRRLAEEVARKEKQVTSDSSEVALSEIYASLTPAVSSAWPAPELAAMELTVEGELLFVDRRFAACLSELLVTSPRPLVVVSDTYFSQDHLRSFLRQTPLRQLTFERIFTSSDHGTGKGAQLWETVIEALEVRPEEIVHIGDNMEADVSCAERAGIRAVHCPVSTERFRAVEIREGIIGREDYPSPWCDPSLGDGGITALRRRATQLSVAGDLSPHEQVAWETGTSVFGPVFTGFAQWVYEQSEAVGAHRLLFLMREGQLLKEFVERARGSSEWSPSLRTAWVSREACARASIFEGSKSELLSFLERLRPPTPSQLSASFGLESGDLPDLSALDDAFMRSNRRQELSEAFVDRILAQPALIEKVVAQSALKRERLMRYLRTVAGPGTGPVGLVDVGWSGSIQESLHAMWAHHGDPLEFHGLYLLAHVGSSARALRGVSLQGYLGTLGTDPFDVAAITGGAEIVELVSTCDEGSLLEIGSDGEPVLASPAGGAEEQRSRHLVQSGAKSYQKEWLASLPRREPCFETSTSGVALLTRVLKRFVSQPNHDEALAFNWWLHEENYGSEGTEQLVPPRYLPTIRHRSAEDLHWAPMSDLHWTGGAAALVDHELSDAIFLMREGTVDPGRFSSQPETTAHLLLKREDLKVSEYDSAMVRNRHGLSLVEWRTSARRVVRLELRPADHFMLFRPDLFEVVDAGSEYDPQTLFHWQRGGERSELPAAGFRWLTTQVMAMDASTVFSINFGEAVTSREIRVSLAGAFLPTSDAPDGHLLRDPEAEIAALHQEISDIYGTKLLRAAALPRRLYGAVRRRGGSALTRQPERPQDQAPQSGSGPG